MPFKSWIEVIVPYRRICFQIDRLLTVLQKEKYLDDPVKQFEYSSHGYDQWGFYHTLRAQKPYLKFKSFLTLGLFSDKIFCPRIPRSTIPFST